MTVLQSIYMYYSTIVMREPIVKLSLPHNSILKFVDKMPLCLKDINDLEGTVLALRDYVFISSDD